MDELNALYDKIIAERSKILNNLKKHRNIYKTGQHDGLSYVLTIINLRRQEIESNIN